MQAGFFSTAAIVLSRNAVYMPIMSERPEDNARQGSAWDFLRPRLHPDDRALILSALHEAREARRMGARTAALVEGTLIKGQIAMAKTLQDILDRGAKVQAAVAKNTDLDNSIITMLNAETATLKDLRDQLAQAGQDPQKLQALGDLMDQVVAAQENQAKAKADAITANTGA